MHDKLLRANLDALSLHSPSVARLLEPVEPRADLMIVDTPAGLKSARVGARAIHSLYDPSREAQRMVDGCVSADSMACVVLGLGLGYHVEAVLRTHPGLPVAVVEPDLPLFAAVLRARDLTGALASPDLRLYLGARPEEIASAIEELPLGKTSIVAPASLTGMDPGYYRQVEEAIHATVDRTEINTNTLARFGRLWVRNLLHNVEAFVLSPGVAELEGRFRDLPALVLAAGPSLDQVEGDLGELALRALVIAVDSSVGVCVRAGIRPDLVVTVDPQYWNTRYFDRVRSPGTILVCEPSTNPGSLRRMDNPTVFTSSLFPLGRLLESAGGEKGRVGAGGSVATSAWDIARLLGCAPIYMAGLDLGFPGRRTHARGLYFEELMVSTADRLRPAETQGHRYITDAGSLRAPATDGSTTVTDRRMMVYRWWFERQLARHGAPETRTFSRGSLRIRGVDLADPRVLAGGPIVRPRLEEILEETRTRRPDGERTHGTRQAVTAVLGALKDELSTLAQAAGEGLARTGLLDRDLTARGRGDPAVRRHLEALDRVDRRISTTAGRDVVGFLMQPLIQRIVGSRDSTAVVEAARELYREIGESARLHLGLVTEALERLGSPVQVNGPTRRE